ncbi:sensor histidine kinase [Prosthecomicrobium sp. N25]|uniref:sensor histidine kinase n=1 Tax=Prosthecomicrobium sp. N25 TaxID=3129254 RepID=UPI003076E746
MQDKRAWDGIATDPEGFPDRLRQYGPMGAEIAAFDWSTTPVGPIQAWPASLRTIVHTLASSGQPMALFYGPALTTIFNAGFAPILGGRAETALGLPLAVVWHDVYDEILPMVRQALSGRTVWMADLPLTMWRNGFAEETHWTFSYSPVLDDEGRVVGFLDVVTETTEAVSGRKALAAANQSLSAEIETARRALVARNEAERQRAALQRELVHRIKNLIAVVQAIVVQTIRAATSLDEAADTVTARLSAFGRAQDIFTESQWQAAPLHRIVGASLSPYSELLDRISVDGPDIELDAQQALGIALLLHELTTNALKYGALSKDGGRVAIRWESDSERFALSWEESGGAPIPPPGRKGFGSRLMERVVPSYFSGTASAIYPETGLVYRLEGQPLGTGIDPAD